MNIAIAIVVLAKEVTKWLTIVGRLSSSFSYNIDPHLVHLLCLNHYSIDKMFFPLSPCLDVRNAEYHSPQDRSRTKHPAAVSFNMKEIFGTIYGFYPSEGFFFPILINADIIRVIFDVAR